MGGNALAVPVDRIHKTEIPLTLKFFSSTVKIPIDNLKLLGSTGKQESSGDLDLAVDVNKFSPQIVHERLVKFLKPDHCTFQKGSNIGSYAFPIITDYGYLGDVQIDLMFVENTEWAKFSYFSAGDKSKYKGAIRAILLSAVATSIDVQGNGFSYDHDGSLLMRVGLGIDPNKGLKRMFKMRPLRKDGKGFTKTMKSVTPEEIQQTFPLVKFSKEQVMIDDPNEVVKMLFGRHIKPKHIETVEQIIKLIYLKLSYESELIFQRAAERCGSLVNKMEIPWEIKRYIK